MNQLDNPHKDGQGSSHGGTVSFAEVEAQLVDAVRMSWRLPSERIGGGGAGYASDGPWWLLTKLARAAAAASDRPGAAEWEALRVEIDEQHLRDARAARANLPLTSEEVDWMEARFAWLMRVPEADRKLVWVTLIEHASAKGRISWARIRERLMRNRQWQVVAGTTRGLGMRYSRAIGALCRSLNAGEVAAL